MTNIIKTADDVQFLENHAISACIKAIKGMEQSDTKNYFLILSGDLLTSNILWHKEKGNPPTKIPSGLPDERGLYAYKTVVDLEIPLRAFEMHLPVAECCKARDLVGI